MIVRCQPGYETFLTKELALHGGAAVSTGEGWVQTEKTIAADLTFAWVRLVDPVEITGDSVNQIAARIAELFLTSARTERFEGPWPFSVETAAGLDGLGRRATAVESAVGELLKKRMSRVARLAVAESPMRLGPVRGLFLYFVDFKRVFVAREAILGGQRRMADDDQAPSRSYLKVEEAYGVLGREPVSGETVVDLGAAPGGWSYSAAKRGARVIAIDNGPLKGGALDHPLIEHRREDAFKFAAAPGEIFDWLFCDMVEEPHHVMQHIVAPWLAGAAVFGRLDVEVLLRPYRGGTGGHVVATVELRLGGG